MKTTNNIFCLLLLITISSFKIFGADNKEKTWSPFRNNSTQRYAEEYSEVNEFLVNKDKDKDTLTSKEKITKVLRNSNEYIKLAKAASNKVRELNNYKDKLSKEYELPFAITKKVGGKDYEIIIDSLVITPKYAYAVAYCIIVDSEGQDSLFFGATDIRFNRNGGFTGDAKLFLLRNYQVEFNDVSTLDFFANAERMTYITFDCQGFKELHIELDLWFSPEKILKVENGEPVFGDTLITSVSMDLQGFEDLYFEVSGLQDFQLISLKDFTFSFKNLVVDYSAFKHKSNTRAFKNYTHETFSSSPTDSVFWKGILIEELTVTLPPSFRRQKPYSTSDYEAVSVGVRDLLIDNHGFTGEIFGQNLILKNSGDIEGWDFTLDEINIVFSKNKFVGGNIYGKIGTPITREVDYFDYEGTYSKGGDVSLTVKMSNSVEFPIWKAGDVSLANNSSITLTYQDKKFIPHANLNGVLSINIGIGKKSEIEKGNQEGKNIKLPDITFQNLELNASKPFIKLGTFGFGKVNFMAGMPITIHKIESEVNVQNPDMIGIKVGVTVNLMKSDENGFGAKGEFVIWGKEKPNAKIVKFDVDHVHVNSLELDVKTGEFKFYGKVDFFRDDLVFGSGFNSELELEVMKLNLKVEAKALFGKKGTALEDSTSQDSFRYWYVDANASFKAISVVAGVFSINSFGGGVYYKMNKADTTVDSPYGKTRTGIVYVPDVKMALGLKASIGFEGETPEVYKGELTVEFLFGDKTGLEEIAFYGYVGFLNTKAEKVATSTPKDVKAALASKEAKPANGFVNNKIEQILSEYKFGAYWMMSCDFNGGKETVFNANFGVYVNAPNVVGAINDYHKAGTIDIHISKEKWYIYAGTPQVPAKVKLDGMPIETINVYFVMGSVLPAFEPLSKYGIDIDSTKLDASVGINGASAKGGFAIGSRIEFKKIDKQYLFFYGKLNAFLGFDIMMGNFSGYQCAGLSGDIGFNGWYASGRIYGYAAIDMGLRAKVFGEKRELCIGNVTGQIVLSAKLPNPSYFAGMMGVKYNLLAGLVKGENDFYFDFGKTCILQGDALEGVEIITDMTPSGGKDVSVFAHPVAAFSLPINKSFKVYNKTTGGNDSLLYKVELTKFSLTNENGIELNFKSNYFWSEGNKVLKRIPSSVLPGEKNVVFTVEVIYKMWANGKWEVKGSETKKYSFKTGQEPGNIEIGNVDYSYPLPDMKNYYVDQYKEEGYLKLVQNQTVALTLQAGFKWEQRWYQGTNLVHTSNVTPQILINATGFQDNLQFEIPHDKLKTNLSYTYKLVKVPVSTNTSSTASTGYKQIDVKDKGTNVESQFTDQQKLGSKVEISTTTLSGTSVVANEKVVLELKFNTSIYKTFESHVASMTKLNTTAGLNLSKSIPLNAKDEAFSPYELVGRAVSGATDSKPLIIVNSGSFLNSNYVTTLVKPIYYNNNHSLILRIDKEITGDISSVYIPYKYCSLTEYSDKKYNINWSIPIYIRKDYESMLNARLNELANRLHTADRWQPRGTVEVGVLGYSKESNAFKDLESTSISTLIVEGYKVPYTGRYDLKLDYNLPGIRTLKKGVSKSFAPTIIGSVPYSFDVTIQENNVEQNKYVKEKNNNLSTAQNTRNDILNRLNYIKNEEDTKKNQIVNFAADTGRAILNGVKKIFSRKR